VTLTRFACSVTVKKIDFSFKEKLNNRKMQVVENAVKQCLSDFALYLAQRHKIDPDVVMTDLATWLSGDPKRVASKIVQITETDSESSSDGEIKTTVMNDDDSSVDLSVEPVAPAAAQVEPEDESDEVESDPPPKPKGRKPAPKSTKAKPAKVVEPESEDDESPPPKKTKAAPKGRKAKPVEVQPESEDDSSPPEEDEVVKEEIVLSDTPKMPVKDRPTLSKNVKFQKGTNNVVHGGVVVAIVTKKGLGKLTKVSTKALTTKGVAFEEWTEEKIKKTFKC